MTRDAKTIDAELARFDAYLLIGAGDPCDEAVEGNNLAEIGRRALLAEKALRKLLEEHRDALKRLEYAALEQGKGGCPLCQPVNKWGHVGDCPVHLALGRTIP